jgi:FtsH-binding integral membrane protein
MEQKIKILGLASIGIGIISALLIFFGIKGLFLSLPVGFLGMICSCTYIFFDTKYSINKNRFTAGVLGVILNSIPIVLIMILILVNKGKH